MITLANLRSIYLALKNAVDINVSRAWPQGNPQLPAITYALKSWQVQADNNAICTIQVQIRSQIQEEGDTYTEQVQAAMLGQGFSLSFAQDGQEHMSGFFLRTLQFTRRYAIPADPGGESITFRVWDEGISNYRDLPSTPLLRLQMQPATRQAVPSDSFEQLGTNLAPIYGGSINPGRLILRSSHAPGNLGANLIGNAFWAASELRFLYTLPGVDPSQVQYGQVVAWYNNPLGLYAEIALRYPLR